MGQLSAAALHQLGQQVSCRRSAVGTTNHAFVPSILARGFAMRIVVLSSSLYSETACAMAARLAESGHIPVGALALSTLDSRTVLRKLGQWGMREVLRYASSKLIPHSGR